MNRQKLSQAMAATVASLSIIVFAYLFQPLQGAQSLPRHSAERDGRATPATTIKTEAKPPRVHRRKATIKPFAPPAPTEKDIKKAAHVRTAKVTEKAEDKKESKEEKKQAAAPTTRNLIMIFDDGNDKASMLGKLATGLMQQCAFMIINQQLWELFKTAPAKTFILEGDPHEAELFKALGDQSCADFFCTPHEWDVYAADGQDAGKQDRFYVFVPHQYVITKLDNAKQDMELGLNVSTLAPVNNPLKTAATQTKSEKNYGTGNVLANALAKILCPTSIHPWNVYCIGHGFGGDRNTGFIINLSIPAFENLINFFNTKVHTNFFFYDTCFGGGQHLTIPFITKGAHVSLHYPIVAGSISDAPTTAQLAALSTATNTDPVLPKQPLEAFSKTFGMPVHYFTGTSFPLLFKGLESFANGTSNNSDLIHTLNAVGSFLTPDLQKVAFLENIPQIRFPGTEWFQIIRLAKELPIIHLTRAKVMAKNYDALHNNKPWKFNCAGDKIVLLQTHDIAIPTVIDPKTKLVPLIHSIPFLQQKPLILNHQQMPPLFAFSAPLIAKSGLFEILSALWFFPKKDNLANNVILTIETLICGNDLDESQQKTLSNETALTLKQVMIFLNAENPLYSLSKNTVGFNYNNKPFLIDMDQPTDQLSQLDEKTAQQYQAIYKQCFEYCIDKSVEPLRTANENMLGKKIMSDAIKTIEAMKAELETQKETMLKNNNENAEKFAAIQKQLAAAKNDFLSDDAKKRGNAQEFLENLIKTNTIFAFPTIVKIASTGTLSTHPLIQDNTLRIFDLLVHKQYGFDEAIKAASYCLQFGNKITQANALVLFTAIVQKNKGFTDAIKAAASYFNSTNELIRKESLALFKALLAQKQEVQEEVIDAIWHISAAKNDFLSTDKKNRVNAYKFLENFIKTDTIFAFPLIIKIASTGTQSTNPSVQNNALQIFNLLVPKQHSFNEAIKAASSCLKSISDYVRKCAFELFEALFTKGQGFKEAQAVINQINKDNSLKHARDTAKELQESLNKAMTPAVTAAATKLSTYFKEHPDEYTKLKKTMQKKEEKKAAKQPIKPQPQQNESWVCPTCDTENKAAEKVCVECKKPRPAAS